jgi:hypothetical protein
VVDVEPSRRTANAQPAPIRAATGAGACCALGINLIHDPSPGVKQRRPLLTEFQCAQQAIGTGIPFR